MVGRFQDSERLRLKKARWAVPDGCSLAVLHVRSMAGALVRVSIASLKNTVTKSSLERKGYLEFIAPPHSSSWKEVRQELKAGPWEQPGSRSCSKHGGETLLTDSLPRLALAQTIFLSHLGPPTWGWHLPRWSGLKKMPHRLVHEPIWWGYFFQLRLPLLKRQQGNRLHCARESCGSRSDLESNFVFT